MIDIIISQDGTLTVAHDAYQFGRLIAVTVDRDHKVTGRDEAGEVHSIGTLNERMYAAARECSAAQVAVLEGWEPKEAYPCEMKILAEG